MTRPKRAKAAPSPPPPPEPPSREAEIFLALRMHDHTYRLYFDLEKVEFVIERGQFRDGVRSKVSFADAALQMLHNRIEADLEQLERARQAVPEIEARIAELRRILAGRP